MKNGRMFQKAALLLMLVVTVILTATSCAASISLEQAEYYAEYGERFYIPEPVLNKADKADVTYEVKDAEGNTVTKAALGSFYPEIGTYTLTYTYDGKTASAKIICADTKGPQIEYIDHTKTVFEGEAITVPTFAATDVSGVQDGSASLKIYRGLEGESEISPNENNQIIAEAGVGAYRFVYTVSDIYSNVGKTELITEVKVDYIDVSIKDGYMWDFDEPDYITLVGSHTAADVVAPDSSIVTEGVPDIDGGALKLSADGDGVYAGVNILHGKSINTGEISRMIMRVYADRDITILSVKALREDLANIEFSDLKQGTWYDLEINPRALYPDATDVDHLEISFRNTGATNLYIDSIYSVPFYVDTTLDDNVLGDFNENEYLANVEQAGFDIGKGLISAEYQIIKKQDLPSGALRDGANGSVLKVTSHDVWSEDYGGYGVLGDGLKYYLPMPVNTADINQLFIKFYCAKGEGLALSFFYKDPTTKEVRSKARWMRGVEGEWVTLSVSQAMITQIVPMYPTNDENNKPITDFDLIAIVITSCGNVPDYTVCEEFYIDEISYVGEFKDDKLDSKNHVLGDFDETGYMASLDQAWSNDTNTAIYTVLPAGNPDVPKGADGGVVKITAKQASDVIYPNQGAQGDGFRFYLFEPISFDKIDSVTIRALGVEGKGTAINVGFVIERNGTRMISNAWWQQVKAGEWTNITLDRARLTLEDKDDSTGNMIPRIQKGDILVGVRIWSCAVQPGLEWAREFYIDEISYKPVSSQTVPDKPVVEVPKKDVVLTDFSKGEKITQSSLMWNGQENGKATYAIIDRANESTAKIYGYQWFNNDARKAEFRKFSGKVLEVVSRTGKMDGAKVSFDSACSLNETKALNIEFFSNTANGGYVFYVEDSKGVNYAWRIKTTDYTVYTWTKLSLSVSELKAAGLSDIKSVSFAYACGSGNESYLYVSSVVAAAK